MVEDASTIVLKADLSEFFRERVQHAIAQQRLDATDEAVSYLVRVLAAFSRFEAISGAGDGSSPLHQPLAELLSEARSTSGAQRVQRFRELGDLALYVAGFFSDYLERRLVDTSYYVGMGRAAYGNVAAAIRAGTLRGNWKVFEELGAGFARFVDVLTSVSEDRAAENATSVVRLYERWQRTGDPRAAQRLRSMGLIPVGPGSGSLN